MNDIEISRIAAAISDLRPDWPAASIRSLLNRPELKNKPRRDVAVALAWVACEPDTKTPARVIESGPWWRAAAADGTQTVAHTGKTIGLRHGDPRTICGICDMLRDECESRATTGGHEFVPRSECLPPTTVEGPHFTRGTCLAGPVTRPCRLLTGHEGPHDCPPSEKTSAEVQRLRQLAADPPTDTYLAAKNGLHATTDTSPEEDEG